MQSKQKGIKGQGPKKQGPKKEEAKQDGGKKEGKVAEYFKGFSLRDQLMMLEDPDYAPPSTEHPANFEHEYINPDSPRHPKNKEKKPRWPN